MEPIKDPERIRTKLGFGDEPIVAVMAGGGADAYRLMKFYLDAVEILGRNARLAKLMVTGPFMPNRQRKILRDRANSLGVIIHSTLSDIPSYINAADVIITMAGYNSLTEVMRFRKPTIVVPRQGPSAEQTLRAGLFAQWDGVHPLDPRKLDGSQLAAAIRTGLDNRSTEYSSSLASLSGVAHATDYLLGFLKATKRRAQTVPVDQ
jgi:predicted glycosyltransferase